MEQDMEVEVNVDLVVQSILLAAANHDTTALRNLLRNSSSNVQDPETGFTPLHAAVAACEPEEKQTVNGANGRVNGSHDDDDEESVSETEAAALRTVKLLFQNGAIWNDLDKMGETPGCIAHRLGLRSVYEAIVDAGVRAELLLNRLDSYQPLEDEEGEEEEEAAKDEEERAASSDQNERAVLAETAAANQGSENLEASDTGKASVEPPSDGQPDSLSDERDKGSYLASDLKVFPTRVLDSDNNAVMMDWETEIMKRSARSLLTRKNLKVLNVGHGMGIIDDYFQAEQPLAHHIIEAHPAVLVKMRESGWYEKPNVTIHEGRWQDVMPKLAGQCIYFDAIYFDTFGEDYKDLREFFSEHVVELLQSSQEDDGNRTADSSDGNERNGRSEMLDRKARFGFFNGLGADRQVCYDVYTKVRFLWPCMCQRHTL